MAQTHAEQAQTGQPPRDRTVLNRRALNRAALARQLLLAKGELPVQAAVQHLLGLNAQEPNVPYLTLWSRLKGFRHPDLTERLIDRTVVRSVLFRGTQHLVTGNDFRWVRTLLQPLLTRLQRNTFGRRTAGVDLDELVEAGRTLLRGRTMTRPELARLLKDHWPEADRTALAWSLQYLEPILHPAPSGTWNTRGPTPFELAADVLGPVDAVPEPARLVRRYLAAYGPATVADIRAWSGVAGLREVIEGMRPELRVFTNDAGRELFDLPDAPRPDPDVRAPVRFLPEYDNLMLAYADRTRVMSDQDRRTVCVGDHIAATVLVDGTVAATWTLARDHRTATMTVQPLGRLASETCAAIAEEGTHVLDFAAPDAETRDLRILPPR